MSNAFEAVADALSAAGVTAVFGVMGDGNLPFVEAVTRVHQARYVAAACEDGAVLMADGYARTTDTTGVATVTHGPGLTNTVTALVEAARSRTPLVLVAADTDPRSQGHPQDIDQALIASASGAGFVRVRSAGTAHADAVDALRQAAFERRPVVLNVPVRGLPADATALPVQRPTAVAAQRTAADAEALQRAVAAVTAGRRVVVLAGRGAVRSGARDALIALANRCGALLATTLLAKDWFAGHPFDLGICGGFAHDFAAAEFEAADCVLAFGASLNGFTTDGGRLLASARVVHCDLDAAAVGSWRAADVALLGDARTVAEHLLDLLPDVPSSTARTPAVAAALAAWSYETEASDESDDTGVDLRSAVAVLDRVLPADRLLVCDGGHASLSEPARAIRLLHPDRLLFPLGFGSIGLGLGTAVGAAVAHPGRPVLAVVGDGGLMMSLTELDTAVRERLPLVVAVLNDGAYGYELHNMVAAGIPTASAEFVRPDFAAIARAWGAEGVSVRRLADLSSLGPAVASLDGPLLLDIAITRRVCTTWFRRHES